MNVKIESSWQKLLQTEFSKQYFTELVDFVKKEYATNTCFPPGHQIFRQQMLSVSIQPLFWRFEI